ncbi:hypothetical protein TELCIR_10671, partial [Teladorsagia circumcincta]
LLGALVIPLLHGQLDFFNGIYFAFICLTAIEYGDLVPDNLQVKELITAVGQNIGIGDQIMEDIDLETLVHAAIQVKLGRLSRVPQTHMIVEGIWPPELVPLFLKDGHFPMFVDSDEDLLDMTPKKTVVRFQDEVISDIDDRTTMTSYRPSSRLSPVPQPAKSEEPLIQKPPASPTSQTGSDVSQSLQDTTVDTFVMSSE